jgi:hypothetical protein
MVNAYRNCTKIKGNAYFYSSVVSNVRNCFNGKNRSNRLNIYVVAGSTTNTTVHCNNAFCIVGSSTGMNWTNGGSYQYNKYYNIYIYPVANVAAARAANKD